MAVFDLEVDVVLERDVKPWRERTRYVSVNVEDRPSWMCMENEG